MKLVNNIKLFERFLENTERKQTQKKEEKMSKINQKTIRKNKQEKPHTMSTERCTQRVLFFLMTKKEVTTQKDAKNRQKGKDLIS